MNTRDEVSEDVQILLDNGSESGIILATSPGNNAPLPNVNRIDLANIFSPEFSEAVFSSELNSGSDHFQVIADNMVNGD
ncbi:MAG: hypothetical protein CM1200mP40_12430 [Gammaproteobacteria bacterium]|nr:MAG: hypothetical protein CM1200mP40_12430 [Gammaproteobacteria bacterium]